MNTKTQQHGEETAPMTLQLPPENSLLSSAQQQAHQHRRNPKKPSAGLDSDGGDITMTQDLWVKTMGHHSLPWGDGKVSCPDFTGAQALAEESSFMSRSTRNPPEPFPETPWHSGMEGPQSIRRSTPTWRQTQPPAESGTHESRGRRSPSLLSQLCWWLHICTKLTHLPLG